MLGRASGADPSGVAPTRLHGAHVIFWEQWDLQDFGVRQDGFVAGGGDCLPCDPVDLVEGMGPKQAVISRPDEQLKREGLVFQVTM